MNIQIEVSDDNEGTRNPWWLVIDPKQMMSPSASFVAMSMIYGPFFSREEAEEYIKLQRHNLTHRAVAWCHGGPYGMNTQYTRAIESQKKAVE